MTLELLASDDAGMSAVDGPRPTPFDAVPSALRSAIEERGFETLTAVQQAVLAAAVEDRDLQISSQTGSGKTIALGFVIAAALESPAEAGPKALIIVPTRELATQVCRELAWLLAGLPGASVTSVTGGTPVHLDRRALSRHPQVLVGTPGRLLDHATSGALRLDGVAELVLDEADQMLDMGFREELEGILEKTPTTRRTHLVSATFPKGIQRLAERYQREPLSIEGTRLGEANRDIEHECCFVRPDDRYAALVNLLLLAHGERTLVFVPQRSETTELCERLAADGFAALPLSGELAQSQRVRTLSSFRNGGANVLVATDVAARGLDIPDVALVIHTAPPTDAEVYTHRSGRTGRAGKRGRSVLLSPPSRRRKVTRLLADAGIELRLRAAPSAQEVREETSARAREVLQQDLDAALAEGPAPAQLAHAEQLLAERDATRVVAALLKRLEPQHIEPREVEQVYREREWDREREAGRPAHASKHTPDRRDKPGRHDKFDRRNKPERRDKFERHDKFGRNEKFERRDKKDFQGERPQRHERPGRQGRTEEPGMVRFFANWGANQGANPRRVLAAVCRRGNVTRAEIGSIAIHPNASTFDVRIDAAERFERLASQRDPRDPRTRIHRDRGPRR